MPKRGSLASPAVVVSAPSHGILQDRLRRVSHRACGLDRCTACGCSSLRVRLGPAGLLRYLGQFSWPGRDGHGTAYPRLQGVDRDARGVHRRTAQAGGPVPGILVSGGGRASNVHGAMVRQLWGGAVAGSKHSRNDRAQAKPLSPGHQMKLASPSRAPTRNLPHSGQRLFQAGIVPVAHHLDFLQRHQAAAEHRFGVV
jgi:hypothetical protein